MTKVKKDRVRGVVVSTPTFCTDKYEVRYERIAEHVNWLVEHGIREGDGVIMAAGGLGEGYFLNDEEHYKIMDTLVEAADGRVPTMVGFFELDGRTAVRKAKYAEETGVDFLQVNPPHYTQPVEDEVFEYYRMINDAAEIGIAVYNTPWCAMGFEIRAPLIAKLVELDNVAAVKWSSRDFGNFVDVLKKFADKVNFIDNVGNVLGHMMGMKGFISHVANFNPEVELKLWELLNKGEYMEYMKEHDRTHGWQAEVSAAEDITHRGLGEGTTAKGILEAVGLDVGPPFPPQKRMSKEEVEKIRRIIIKSGILK